MIGEKMRPGFAGKPIPPVSVADVVDKSGNPVPVNTMGFLRYQNAIAGHAPDAV